MMYSRDVENSERWPKDNVTHHYTHRTLSPTGVAHGFEADGTVNWVEETDDVPSDFARVTLRDSVLFGDLDPEGTGGVDGSADGHGAAGEDRLAIDGVPLPVCLGDDTNLAIERAIRIQKFLRDSESILA